MLFGSYEFLFIFLPLAWLAYVGTKKASHRTSIFVLLMFSLAFYAWWSVAFLLLVLTSVTVNYYVGRTLAKSSEGATQFRKMLLSIGVIANLLLLGYFKYADFFIENINSLVGLEVAGLDIVLPIGISFYTFTQIAFLVDAFRGEASEYRLINYGLFITFFPQLIAGPILHHKEMMPQFTRTKEDSGIGAVHLCLGFGFLSIGLFKKLVVADQLATFANPVFDAVSSPSFIEAWIASLAYTFQLYFDFSGYSDMAIGISLMFGIWLPLNFNSPYKALSIIDFWRRWHMTLSRFLRDYLYIPMGGGRFGAANKSRNIFVTMALGGLWHGAGWTFVIWGTLHGVFLIINHHWRNISESLPSSYLNRTSYQVLSAALTFLCVVVGWVFFRANNLQSALDVLGGMIGLNGLALPNHISARLDWLPRGWIHSGGTDFAFPDPAYALVFISLIAIAVFFLPNTQQIILGETKGRVEANCEESIFFRTPPHARAILTAAVALIAIGYISDLSPFLYFQF